MASLSESTRTRPTAGHVEVAKRLLARDGASDGTADDRAAAAGRVYARLFRSLAPVIGAAAVRALFARAVKLSKGGSPCLEEVLSTAKPLASASDALVARRLVDSLSKLAPEAASEVATALFATLLDLTSTFIGERLVSQIVKNAFPTIDGVAPAATAAATGTKETS